MSTDQQIHTLLSMQRFGGSFASKLAEAGLAADPGCRARLFKCFDFIEANYGPGSAFYSEDLC